jgi:hypothetical protein
MRVYKEIVTLEGNSMVYVKVSWQVMEEYLDLDDLFID